MIEQVQFKNFKALRDVTLGLSPFTLIVGPNASGKTSILEGIHSVTQLASKAPKEVFRGLHDPSQLRSSGAAGEMVLSLGGKWAENHAHLRISVSDLPDGKFGYSLNVNSPDFTIEGSPLGFVYGGFVSLPAPVREAVGSALLLHLDPRRLGEASYSVAPVPRVEFNGGNLAATLADLALTSPTEFQEVCARVRAVVPSVRNIGFDRVPIDKTEYVGSDQAPGFYEQVRAKYVGYRIKLDCAGAEGVPGHALSEGTLITLGLITLLSSQPVPQLVMIDELERGLHPKALGTLVKQLRSIQGRFPQTQLIGTTHSPYLVDDFDAGEVVLTAVREDGSVVAGTLNEHPEFERWKDEMKPGEFWSTVGEDWLRERKEPAGG